MRENRAFALALAASLVLHVGVVFFAPGVSLGENVAVPAAQKPLSVRLVRMPSPKQSELAQPEKASPAPASVPQKKEKKLPVPRDLPKTKTSPARDVSQKMSRAESQKIFEASRDVANTGEVSGGVMEGRPSENVLPGTSRGENIAGAGEPSIGVVDVNSLVVLKKKRPDYPLVSRKRKEEGTAVLLARVEGGRVVACDVETSSGYPMLDASAVVALRGWLFENSANVRVRVPFTFVLTAP